VAQYRIEEASISGPTEGEHFLEGSLSPVLQITNLTKWFGGQQALNGIDLLVSTGELHALVGHNGSGKSTLVKILSGYHKPESGGVVRVDGQELKFGSSESSWSLGMRFVHQDLGLVASLTVAENLLLGSPARNSVRPFRPGSEIAHVEKALRSFGMPLDPRTEVAALSESERAVVAVARALDTRQGSPKLLVLDEVTTSMPWPEAKRLMGIVRNVAAQGVGVLFITHHIDEVLQGADCVTVFRDGRRVVSTTKSLGRNEIVSHMVGEEVEASDARPLSRNAVATGPVVLKISSLQGELISSLDLMVRNGEIVGITGLTGSGREEVASLLSGRSVRGGDVTVGGKLLRPADPRAAISLGLMAVPADRAQGGLITRGTVRENLTLANVRSFVRHGAISSSHEAKECRVWVDRLNIVCSSIDTLIETLSGGNQQKTVLARWLSASPTVLVLDEPTHGVDVTATAEIHRYIDQVAAQGTAVVVCSSDVEELARLCHRVLFVHEGVVHEEIGGQALTPSRIEALQLGEYRVEDHVQIHNPMGE
jgi:ribose transport system ATP-binding protein